MQAITAPISPDEPRENRAAILANLQDSIRILTTALKIHLIGIPDTRREPFLTGLKATIQLEQQAQQYGEGTQFLVKCFQQRALLPVTGNVDVATAGSMNAELTLLDVLRTVEGRVTNRDGSPVVGGLISAFDIDNIGGLSLGSSDTNGEGAYVIFYDPSLYKEPFKGVLKVKETIDLVVQVHGVGGVVLAESPPLHGPDRQVTVDLTIDEMPASKAFMLRGQVFDLNGPVNGVEVSVFDRDLFFGRDEANNGQRLGTATTRTLPPKNEDGCFEFSYRISDFSAGDILRDGEIIPDLIFALSREGQAQEKFQVFRLPDGNGFSEETPVSDDELILGIQSRRVEEVRIVLSGGQLKPQMSEYERVWRAIEPLLPEPAPADADAIQREKVVCEAATRFDEENHRDFLFVARETALDQLLIKNFAGACKLAVDPFQNVLAPSVFYALARLRGVSDLLSLARLSTDDLTLALQLATTDASPLIPPFDPAGLLNEAVQTIRNVIANRLPDLRSSEGEPSLADLVGADLPNPDDQATLWRTYSDHVGTTTQFWQKLKDQPGFEDPNKIPRLQYAFQLGLLAQNNVSLIDEVRSQHPDVVETSDLAFQLDTAEKWNALLDKPGIQIPADVPGPPEDRKANYAASLAGAIQIAHPTASVASMVSTLPPAHLAETQPAVAKFLTGAVQEAKFDLNTGRIDELVTEHGDKLLEGVAREDRPAVINQVKRVQRLFRLSSGPESLKALLDAGFQSARDIVHLPSALAMDMLTPALGETPARLMLNRANSITSEAIHKFVLLNDQLNGHIPLTLKSLEASREMGDPSVQGGPDYASLFGSVELCECQECRSVYSAAAYLVDLLQFLSLGLQPENPMVTPLDVLIGNKTKNVKGRRPDIAHLELSCENTNTVLPYVDLVNEVLESYIAFDQTLPLKTDEAGAVLAPPVPLPNESSEGITPAELAANPEHTVSRAYEKLEGAFYPFNLPFNQPLTAFRLTLDQMGSSRHEVMDLFRRDDLEPTLRAVDVEALALTEREFAILTGEQFDGVKTLRPVSDFYGFEAPVAPTDTEWVAGSLPAGARQQVTNDSWTFAAFVPSPNSRKTPHASTVAAGLHQHFFDNVPGLGQLEIGEEDLLFAEVFLDPDNLPQEVMLQWNDGTWEHRAYWGQSKINVGVESTSSRRYMGVLPKAGEWLRLEVPAYFVGLGGRNISGMAFTLFDGGAQWGAAGKRTPSWQERTTHVSTFLSRTAVTYVELIDLLRTNFVNPALPTGAELITFERIPISYGALKALVARNFADPDEQTLKALDDAGMALADLNTWANDNFQKLGKLLVLDAPDSACDLTITRLRHLDDTELDDEELSRVHRFIRLWRRLPWTMQDVDRAQLALGAADITPAFLRQIGNVVELRKALKLTPQELLSFWGAIPTKQYDSLYHKLFLNKAVREIDAVFEPVKGEYLPVASTLKIKDHVPALLAGLRSRATDLDLIRRHLKLESDAAPLTLATTTALYRYISLARALKLAVKDLIYLEVISNEQPFSTLNDNASFTEIDPARTLRFVKLAGRVKQSGFTPANLAYLFGDLADTPSGVAPMDESISLLLATIREGLIRLAVEQAPSDDLTGEETRARLSLIFEAHIVEQITGLVAGTQIYSVPLANLPAAARALVRVIPSESPLGKVTYNEKGQLLAATGWLTDSERDNLIALSKLDDYQQAVASLYDQPRQLLNQTLAKELGWTTVEKDLTASVLETTSLAADGTINSALVAGKFKAFLNLALPYIRTTLSRALVKQTLMDALNLEPATASMLLEGTTDQVLLRSDAKKELPAIVDFLSLSGDGLQATYFEDEAFTKPLRSSVDTTIDFHFDGKHEFSVRWLGQLLADKTQRYQFHLRAGGKVLFTLDNDLLSIDRKEGTLPSEYTVEIDLEAGKLYELKLEYSNHEADALIELRWSGTDTPAEIIPSYRFYSDRDVPKAAEHTYIRLDKASSLVNGFKLTPREIAYLAQPRKIDGSLAHPNALDLNDLPVDKTPADQHAIFAAWTRWNDFVALRAYALRDPAALLDVTSSLTVNEAQAALVRACGLDANSLAELAGIQGFDLQDEAYKDTTTLLRVADSMRLLEVLGAPATEVFGWASAAPNMDQLRAAAQQAKRAHKARYDNEAWLEIARPIADQLRESSRAALVSYLMPRLGFTDTGELFGHFLIDVEMSPCMQTSRIKQAISSVQLFIQRCRMNLERGKGPKQDVDPRMIDADRWQWMQNYRVWEANLKIFLYPENWIEPELRDDKSPFFRELESELLQGEITTENAEMALNHYLEKVGGVSHLQICGVYEEVLAADEEWESVLHVFGHSFSTPRVFYYRQRITVNASYRYWTPWEKVPVDIEADEVLPINWNRRLYVFWEVSNSKAEKDANGQDTGSAVVQRRLAWTEYRYGKWAAKQMTAPDQAVTVGERPTRLVARDGGDQLTVEFWTYVDKAFGIVGGSMNLNPAANESPFARTRMGSLTFLNTNGLVSAAKAAPAQVKVQGFMPRVLSLRDVPTELEFFNSTDSENLVRVFARLPSGALRFFGVGPRLYTLDDPFFLQEGPRAYLVQPHSLVSAGSLESKGMEVTPYQLDKSPRTAHVFNGGVEQPVKDQLQQLSTSANPWVASRAGIASSEMRTLESSGFGSPNAKAVTSLSVDSQNFSHAVLNPGFVPLFNIAEFRFETFFHPYAAEFQRRLNRYGISRLLDIDSQRLADKQRTNGLPKVSGFGESYQPTPQVRKPWPEHTVEFEMSGAYSLYNWELFFHVPLFIATRLSQNQKFEEATRWFQFIFDPTALATLAEPAPQCYWKVLPFRNEQPVRLDDMLKAMKAGNADLIAQWNDLQAHPFQPHRVARLRLIAYQKSVVMKYVDNLVAWGDQLFRRDSMESINQATQLYVMAAELLGPRPQRLPQRGRNQSKTYDQLRTNGFDKFNQTLVSFENDLPFSSQTTSSVTQTDATGLLGIGRTFYFGIPSNDKLLGYWDTVSDRLFKIRHCMNIDGVVRELPLFEPPIDPALLVRAAAQGIDLSSVLNDLSAPLPLYRFGTLLGQALELTSELRSLGAALLAALEKRDTEHLSSLRATHETELLSLVKQLKQQQLEETKATKGGLEKSREVTQARFDFYSTIPQRIAEETDQLSELKVALEFQAQAQTNENSGSTMATYAPDISAGISFPLPEGIPVTASLSTTLGRGNFVAYYQGRAREEGFKASVHTYYANESSILGNWKRRAEDWRLQKELASLELAQIDKQIAAADIRIAIAQQDLDNTTRQIEQSQEVEEFLRTKFTSKDLYSWMQGEISTVYFQCYQMTYDLAKKAERCFRFERGLVNSNYIQFGSWDSLRKGLMSGERLYLQLKQMERAYMDGNRRDYELTKHYSLLMNDAQALINLKGQGECEIELPEALFDTDYPGHYMRRIKSVSLTIPAVVGPYTSLNCTLTLLKDKTRVKATRADGYLERDGEEDDRFMTNWAPLQAIATSSGQNDAGLFELNFRDERYLPFEGAGAISRWRIVLDQEANAFDFQSLSDVVLHIRFTAREGGESLKRGAQDALAEAIGEAAIKPLARLFSLKHEFPTDWHRFTHSAAPAPAVGSFTIDKERFPFMFRGKGKTLTVGKVHLYAVMKEGAESALPLGVGLTPPAGVENLIEFELRNKWREILSPKSTPSVNTPITAASDASKWVLKADPVDLANRVEDLLLMCEYTVELNR